MKIDPTEFQASIQAPDDQFARIVAVMQPLTLSKPPGLIALIRTSSDLGKFSSRKHLASHRHPDDIGHGYRPLGGCCLGTAADPISDLRFNPPRGVAPKSHLGRKVAASDHVVDGGLFQPNLRHDLGQTDDFLFHDDPL